LTQPTDHELETSIATMLAWGVTVSSIAVLTGGVLYLKGAQTQIADYAHFHAAAPALRTILGVLQGVRQLDAQSIIQLGLMLLIATPVVRVLYCLIGFLRQRDKLYTGVSFVVLAVLIYSLTNGAR
jgi:uncharacterized membrane protein